MKHKEPRGSLHLLEPALQRKVQKDLRRLFSKLWKLQMENFFAIKEARKSVAWILYGDEGDRGVTLRQKARRKR